jgi:hypothetical protein
VKNCGSVWVRFVSRAAGIERDLSTDVKLQRGSDSEGIGENNVQSVLGDQQRQMLEVHLHLVILRSFEVVSHKPIAHQGLLDLSFTLKKYW